MKSFIMAIAIACVGAVSYAGEVVKEYPINTYTVAPVCKDGKCCTNGQCFIKEPRFERNVSVSTTCDSCGVKETTRTVSRTRRRR